MNYIISIEGQSIPMPEEVASSDDKLKAALAPYFPGAANSKIMRSDPKDETITVTVIKQAGTKGAGTELMKLIAAPESHNPVAELFQRLNDIDERMIRLSSVELLALDEEIGAAQSKGEEQRNAMRSTQNLLERMDAQPAMDLVEGF